MRNNASNFKSFYHGPRSFVRMRLGFFLLATAVTLFPAYGQGPAIAAENQSVLAIHHIDVGQGDATLIIAPNGKKLLIDGGNRGRGYKNIAKVLEDLSLDTIDYLLATHYDADHIGGLDEVVKIIKSVPSKAFDYGESPKPKSQWTKQYKEYREAIGPNYGDRRVQLKAGVDNIDLGAEISVRVVAANGEALLSRLSTSSKPAPILKTFSLNVGEENAKSVALKISYNCFDYFIGGDLTGGGKSGSRITKNLEAAVAPIVGDVDVLHVDHHGSQTSSDMEFLRTLSPEVAVISVGNGHPNSRYHHPRRAVLDRLHTLNKEYNLKRIFMTNQGETDGGLTANDHKIMTIANGNIAIFSNGRSYVINGKTFKADRKCFEDE